MEKQKLILRNEKEMRVIIIADILAIQIIDYFCTFHIEGESPFSCTKSLKEIIPLLPQNFMQVSRSSIVNLDKIKSIELKNKTISLGAGTKIGFSSRNEKKLKEHFDAFTG